MRETSLAAVVAVTLLFSTPSCCSIWRRAEPAGTPASSTIGTALHHEPATSGRSLSTTTQHTPSDSSELSPQSASAWLQQASDPAHVFKLGCTEDDTSGWVDNCDILASSQQHKLQLSALLTVCQLQSSTHAHIPLECHAWLDGQAEVGRCIDAFSRFPQYWNSYTTFSSSISNTCYALSREQNLAVFKRVYQKLLFHQQVFQEAIFKNWTMKQEKDEAMQERLSSWNGRFESLYNDMRQTFTRQSKRVDLRSKNFETSLAKHEAESQEYAQQLDALLHNFRSAVEQLPSFLREAAGRETEQLRHHVQETFAALHRETELTLRRQASSNDLSLRTMLENHENGLARLVSGLDSELSVLSAGLREATSAVASHTVEIRTMQAEGAIASQHMASIKTAAEKNVELVSSHHEIMQQLLFEQSEATAKLVNVTKNAYHNALMRGLWTVKWLGVVMALYPRYKYFLTLTYLRIVATSVGIALIVASWPEFFSHLLHLPYTILGRLFTHMYPEIKLPQGTLEEAYPAPWRTVEGKDWFRSSEDHVA